MTPSELVAILNQAPSEDDLWQGQSKIPWHEPGFSARMLAEHLTQAHDMASRRLEAIAGQAQWILSLLDAKEPSSLLDLGCGPGLYAPHLVAPGHRYLGIDLGPASIAHAREHFAAPGRAGFRLGDVRSAPLVEPGCGPHDLAMMLYGEINVFSPQDCAAILARVLQALKPGGLLLLELQPAESVRALAQVRAWSAAESGLFSDRPHLWLTQGHWFEESRTALQRFHILDPAGGEAREYRSTTRAWDQAEFTAMLGEAGFGAVTWPGDWPGLSAEMVLVAARRT